MIDVENGETPIFKQPALVRSVVFKNWCQLPPLLLCLKHQIPEEMNQAERMLTVIQEVRSPGIMDADAFENRQDPNRVQRVLSAALIHMIMGEGRSTRDMLPVSLPSHRQARFVLMNNGGFDQRLFDLLLDGSQLGGRALDQFPHRSFTHLDPQQVTEDFTGAFQRQQLLVCQIDGHRCDQRSVLDGGRHSCGERGQREVLTAGTLLLFCAVFLHDQPWRWHVHHLPTKDDARLDLPQIVLTGRADGYQMLNHFIWRVGQPQGRSLVSLLPSGFLLAVPLVHAGADFLLQWSCLYFTGFHDLWQVPSGPRQLQYLKS